jgi:hypothetical protein
MADSNGDGTMRAIKPWQSFLRCEKSLLLFPHLKIFSAASLFLVCFLETENILARTASQADDDLLDKFEIEDEEDMSTQRLVDLLKSSFGSSAGDVKIHEQVAYCSSKHRLEFCLESAV